jgi:uncharacterized protein YegP (UPF0339 family)
MAGKFELKVAKDGQFYFRLKAGNGQTILASEMYKAKASALNGIESVKKNAPLDERYEKLVSKSEKPYFVLKAGNHEVIGTSELYESDASRDNGIESVKSNAPEAEVVEVESAEA